MSPGKKLLRVASSPGRFIKTTMREGSVNSSVFSLVIVCLGAGTLTIPNVMYQNGYILGAALIIFGGLLSAFTGYLIAYAAHKTGGSCFEEIALATHGKGMMKFTSYCMLPANIGFLTSYFVVFKTYMPYSIELASGKTLPKWCGDSLTGQIFWVFVLYCIMVPITMPRKLTQLRYASLASIVLSFYLVLVIIIEACLDHGSSPTLKDGWNVGTENTTFTVYGIVNSMNLCIFAFMYQVNIPALYSELEDKTIGKGKTVIFAGTILAVVLYITAGIFGYISFADANGDPDVDVDAIFSDNILKAPYSDGSGKTPIVIYISLFGMCCVVTIATPFCVLPCKDGIEEIRNKKFTPKENVCWTIVLNTIGAVCAMPFFSISVPMALLGATTNSAVGFFLPIIFYLKLEKKSGPWTNMKIISYMIFGLVAVNSVIGLYYFVLMLLGKGP